MGLLWKRQMTTKEWKKEKVHLVYKYIFLITILSGYKNQTLLFAASTWRNQERHKGCLQIHHLQHKWTSR